MKKPIIIAQSAFQGFGEKFRRFAKWAPLAAAPRVPPGDLGVALVMYPPRFSSRRLRPATRPYALNPAYPRRTSRIVADLYPACIIPGAAIGRAGELA
ncbi:MAG TPA: hypothetical protein VMS84_16730 [Mycobacterium sp.]|nr:hypothetical protein [Mycobacterium sp.]